MGLYNYTSIDCLPGEVSNRYKQLARGQLIRKTGVFGQLLKMDGIIYLWILL